MLEKACNFSFVYDDISGIDFAFIELDDTHRQVIATKGAVALEGIVLQPPDFEVNSYICFGFPHAFRNEVVDLSDADSDRSSFGLAMIRVHPIKQDLVQNIQPRFVARRDTRRITHDTTTHVLDSINGMSGGPIFAVRLDTKGFKCRLLAVQSFESQDHSIVGGTFWRHAFELWNNRDPFTR